MYKKVLFLVALIQFSFSAVYAQTLDIQDKIVIGTKFNYPSEEIQNSISKGDFNLYDSFEYEFLDLFLKYAKEKNFPIIEFKTIDQSKRLTYLHTKEVDAIVFSISITKERKDNGYLFSTPYFSNKSIVLVSNNPDIDVRNFHKEKIRIGYVINSTSQTELQLVKQKYKDNIDLVPYSNFDTIIADLRNEKIDATAGDISRLATYLLKGDLYFSGNLPTTKSQVEDKYGIVTKNALILPFFNSFINDKKTHIEALRNKWFSNVEYLYQGYYSRNSFSYKILIYIGLGILLLFSIVVLFFLRKLSNLKKEKEKIQNHEIVDTTTVKLTNMLDLVSRKFREKLDPEEIVNIGLEFFGTAKEKVTYIGSGGFLADKQYGEIWKKGIHDALDRGIILDRIIDLPQINFNELAFKNMDYFHPENYDRTYVQKYLKWLLLQYIDLSNFGSNYKIHSSRGASLWGYGIVIMIKDNTEVLIFTTNQDKKIGSVIANQELAAHFAELMDIIKNVGKDIDQHDLEREFFTTENNLKSLITEFKNEFQSNSCIKHTKEKEDKINNISEILNKRFNAKNNVTQ